MFHDFSKTIKLIPTYNEKENVEPLVKAIFALYPETSVMFIDDASPDGTGDSVRILQSKFPNLQLYSRSSDRGLGLSYLAGFYRVLTDARYDYVVMMDADFSHDPISIGVMLDRLTGCDGIIGSRYIVGGRINNWHWHRRLLSRFANIYARIILGLPIKDMTTGFMCFRKDILRKIDLDEIHSDGYAFLVELKYRLFRAGACLEEYPITFTERREGQSKMSPGVIWESVWLPWKLRLSKN